MFFKNINLFRVSLILVFSIPLFFLTEFKNHFLLHFTGGIKEFIVVGEWKLVVFNIVFFLMFLIPLSYRKKIDWSNYGMVGAFFASLFIEMYGIPLTVFLTANTLTPRVESAEVFASTSLLGVPLDMTYGMAYSLLLMTVGTVLILVGWITLFRNIKKDVIVSSGIYKYSRHPQYVGFILVIFGWIVGWPTPLAIVLGGVLIWKYLRVCTTEEKELSDNSKYQQYKQGIPFLV